MKKYKVKQNDTGLTILKYLGNAENIKIPKNIKGTIVTSIGSDAFSYNKEISTITYQSKIHKVRCIDGYTMIIDSEKTKGEFNILKCRYFGDGLDECIVAQRGEYFAHGDNIKQAIEDVNFKFLQENLVVDDLVKEIKEKQTVSVSEYRLLTGACRQGCENFRQENKIKNTELPLDKVLKLTREVYGGNRMRELFI